MMPVENSRAGVRDGTLVAALRATTAAFGAPAPTAHE